MEKWSGIMKKWEKALAERKNRRNGETAGRCQIAARRYAKSRPRETEED